MASIMKFLEARIGEDEALAIAVIAKHDPDDWENPTATGNFWPEEVAFWDSATPYRALAECEAKRAMVAMHTTCDDVSYGDASTCPEIRAIASVYAGHPDYQQEWEL